MINLNGNILEDTQAQISINNRGFTYGDAVFETLRFQSGKILFWEDHYFRLMASMRILRMQIPMDFTLENLEEKVIELAIKNNLNDKSARVKIMVYRDASGLYTPSSQDTGYVMQIASIDSSFYTLNESFYEVTLFKDHYIAPDLLSTLKTNNKVLNVLAGIFSKENGYQNAILLNTNKMIVEAINGNLFLVKGNKIKTPPIADGCLKGILRTQLIRIIEKTDFFEIEEDSISPFELQKADELFITNVVQGIQPISKYRKKEYENKVAKKLIGLLNAKVRLEK